MEECELPPLAEGQRVTLQGIFLNEGRTSPPSHLQEHELLSLMERHEIGTDASMATHIANICDRNYVELGAGRTLVPTDLGITLVHGCVALRACCAVRVLALVSPSFCFSSCHRRLKERCAHPPLIYGHHTPPPIVRRRFWFV